MFSYDEFPYESATTRVTHPDQIGTIAFLFGLEAAPDDRRPRGAGTVDRFPRRPALAQFDPVPGRRKAGAFPDPGPDRGAHPVVRRAVAISPFPRRPPGEQAAPEGALRFRDHRGTAVTPGLPATTRALTLLADSWPRAMRFDELAARVAESPGVPDPAAVAAELTNNLLRMAFLGSISLMRAPPEIAGAIGEQPAAAAHARWQAARRPHALNRHHTTIALDEAERGLVALLDGTRDRGALDAEWRRLTGDVGRSGAAGADEVPRGLLDRAMLID